MPKRRRRNTSSTSMEALSYRNTNPHPLRSIRKVLHLLKRNNSRRGIYNLHPSILRPCLSGQRAHNRQDSLQNLSTRRFLAMAGRRRRRKSHRNLRKNNRVPQSSQCWQRRPKVYRAIARLSLAKQGRAAVRRRCQR